MLELLTHKWNLRPRSFRKNGRNRWRHHPRKEPRINFVTTGTAYRSKPRETRNTILPCKMPVDLSWPDATMRAVVYDGVPFSMSVRDIAKPTIRNSTDVVVRVTTSAICGSDLHIYRGFMGGIPPWTMGHEAVGYVSEIGDAVSFNVGDYVIIPDTVSSDQLELEPTSQEYFGFGNSVMGLGGLQAEYARIPFAETNLIPIPLTHETTNSTIEHDYLTVSDVFATAWAGIDYSGFQPGDSVAVFGAGPVGLLSAYSAILRGASKVYVVDHVQQRLDIAKSIGAIPIDFAQADPVVQILAHEPSGVMRSVDCVGMEALNADLERDASIVVNQMINVTHFGGGVGQLGVFSSQDNSPGAPYGSAISPSISFPISSFFGKALSFRTGAVDPKSHWYRGRPGFLQSDLQYVEPSTRFITIKCTRLACLYPGACNCRQHQLHPGRRYVRASITLLIYTEVVVWVVGLKVPVSAQ
ncbi:putative zinc-type alcohol dehydrogenase-like protein AdhB [Colletotrichum fructicola Nara gc5]|uniref:Putative zinc-type alcohol dehydrogenase-like protein AdhB n=1 Tax=Colletotrichum fructicola (strain Nara gc5) TaxID=1213859 RepID=A0A7J6IDG5_COLFN|nr:putative zinc-type alcohol dehydrogenase-like protein AdhB [Colletotrichum fructicola Nara gc5]